MAFSRDTGPTRPDMRPTPGDKQPVKNPDPAPPATPPPPTTTRKPPIRRPTETEPTPGRKPRTRGARRPEDLPPVPIVDPNPAPPPYVPYRPPQPPPPREVHLSSGSGSLIPAIYGSVRLRRPPVFYRSVDSTGRLIVGYMIGWGELNSISNIKVGGKTLTELGLTSSTTDYNTLLGTTSQSAPAILSTYESDWLSSLPGQAVVVLRFKPKSAGVPQVNPADFECDVEGIKIRDPRTDATLVNRYYRANPALALADFYTSDLYGFGRADAEMDWSTSITEAANFCDDDLDPGAGTTTRYEIGIVLDSEKSVQSWISEIRVHAQLFTAWNGEQHQIICDKARTASGIVFTDQGTEANIVTASMRVRGAADVPNHITVHYTDASAGYADRSVSVVDPDVDAGTVERIPRSYTLTGCQTVDQAKRIATYLYNRVRLDKEISLTVLADGLEPLPGSIVEVTSIQLNMTLQKVIVTAVNPLPDGLGWSIAGEIYDAGVYSDSLYTGTVYVAPTVPSPYDQPPWPAGVAVTAKSAPEGIQTTAWTEIPIRSTTQYGASYWSTVNCAAVTAANINDGDFGTKALDINAAGTSEIKFDAGVGNTVEFRELVMATSGAALVSFFVEYSDDDSAYTSVGAISANGASQTLVDETGADFSPVRYVKSFASGGAHRYWRLRQSGSSAEALNFNEIQFYEFLGDWRWADVAILTDAGANPSGATVGLAKPEALRVDTMSLGTYSYSGLNDSGYTRTYSSQLHVRSAYGLVSYGVQESGGNSASPSTTGYAPDYIAKGITAPTLVNGANNGVPISSIATVIRCAGPTAVFTITGFSATDGSGNSGEAGRTYSLWNATLYSLTLSHEGGTSTAANRLSCPDSLDLVIPPGGHADLFYEETNSRWRVVRPATVKAYAKAYKTSSQSINNATDTALVWQTEELDSHGFIDLGSDNTRITIPSGFGGVYVLSAEFYWDNNTTGARYAKIFKNGSIYSQLTSDPAASHMGFSAMMSLSASDYLQIVVYQTSGAARSVVAAASPQTAWVQIVKV